MAGTGKGPSPRQRELGQRVRDYRSILGYSQERLAHEASINRTYIATLEAGERNPSLDLLVRLAKALEVPLGELVDGLEGLSGDRT